MNDKNTKCHQDGHQKAHRWMMVLCALLMMGILLVILSSSQEVLSLAYLSSAIVPLIICLVLHGLMMKLMMTREKQTSEENEKPLKTIENNSQFKA